MFPIRDVNPTRIRPFVTWAIIAANVLVYFALQPQQSPEADEFVYQYAAIPCEVTTGHPLDQQEIASGVCSRADRGTEVFPDKSVWAAVVVSMFLHGGIAHLLFNMWSLWIFGNNVEEAFGPVGYLAMYGAAGVAATLGFVLVNRDLTVPLVGASGAIAGVMGAYLVLFPRHMVMTLVFFRVVAIPSVIFLGIWLVTQFALVDQASGIAWEAHVAGFIFGALLTLALRPVLLRRTLAVRSGYERTRRVI